MERGGGGEKTLVRTTIHSVQWEGRSRENEGGGGKDITLHLLRHLYLVD